MSDPKQQPFALSSEVLSAALREVRATYNQLNASLFQRRLGLPTFEWTGSTTEWGAWVSAHRIIRLSERLLHRPWGDLVEVLKHEMAHQYVDEVEGAAGEGPHGGTFHRVCRARGIDPGATGDPHHASDEDSSDPEVTRRRALLSRILGLLSLAQSDNEHEAQTAMATARRLMLKYNLSAIAAELSGERRQDYFYRHLGACTGRRMSWQRQLVNVLTTHFFVEIIIVPSYRPADGKRGSVLEACGTRANLEMAEYAHDFLENAAQALWAKHKREQRLKRDRDKQSFLYGVMTGFSEKLDGEAKKTQQEGLVWLGDPELSKYLRARHPHIRHVSGRSQVKEEAFSAGKHAGGRIVLYRGMKGSVNDGAPRLLRGDGGS